MRTGYGWRVAVSVGVSEVKFMDEFLYAHIMMLRHALENTGRSFHFNWTVHRDHFMMFPVPVRSYPRMGTAAADDFIA